MSQDRSVPDSRTPPFQQVADRLRMEILDGQLDVGERLPTQNELVKRFEVSRSTIQRALEELQEGGYIESHQGRGAFVVDWRTRRSVPVNGNGGAYHPDKAIVALPGQVEAAFEAEEVSLDAFCFTAETLNYALARPLGRIRSGELTPRKITARLLLPSFDVQLGLPRSVDAPSDRRPLKRFQQLARSQALVVLNSLRDLQAGGYVPEVDARMRTVPITPLFKLYLLNRREALMGYYRVVEREVVWEGQPMPIYDCGGLGAVLFRHVREEASPMTQQVEESQRWFDSVWSKIAQKSTLSE